MKTKTAAQKGRQYQATLRKVKGQLRYQARHLLLRFQSCIHAELSLRLVPDNKEAPWALVRNKHLVGRYSSLAFVEGKLNEMKRLEEFRAGKAQKEKTEASAEEATRELRIPSTVRKSVHPHESSYATGARAPETSQHDAPSRTLQGTA